MNRKRGKRYTENLHPPTHPPSHLIQPLDEHRGQLLSQPLLGQLQCGIGQPVALLVCPAPTLPNIMAEQSRAEQSRAEQSIR